MMWLMRFIQRDDDDVVGTPSEYSVLAQDFLEAYQAGNSLNSIAAALDDMGYDWTRIAEEMTDNGLT